MSSAGDFQVHPDKGGTKDAFHQVYQAFDVLSNPQRRRKWLERNSFTLLDTFGYFWYNLQTKHHTNEFLFTLKCILFFLLLG